MTDDLYICSLPEKVGQGGKYVRVKADESIYEYASAGGGAPDPHAASHQDGGTDELALAQSQIASLETDLAGKSPTSHNHDAAYSALGHTHSGVYEPAFPSRVGQALKYAQVKADETGFQYSTPAGGGGINTLKKTADQIINGTAFQNITGLTFAVVSGTDYAFHFYIVFRSAQTTTGFRFAVNAPAGTLDFFHTYQTVANSETAGVATWLQKHSVTRDAMTVLTTTITAAVDLVCIIEGRYKCTANGTLAARVASELANNDLVVQKGSWGTWF